VGPALTEETKVFAEVFGGFRKEWYKFCSVEGVWIDNTLLKLPAGARGRRRRRDS
jgi:hypothetical protein